MRRRWRYEKKNLLFSVYLFRCVPIFIQTIQQSFQTLLLIITISNNGYQRSSKVGQGNKEGIVMKVGKEVLERAFNYSQEDNARSSGMRIFTGVQPKIASSYWWWSELSFLVSRVSFRHDTQWDEEGTKHLPIWCNSLLLAQIHFDRNHMLVQYYYL